MSGRLFGTGISPPTALKAIGKTLEHSARHYLTERPFNQPEDTIPM